jgi:hypothetical protein
MAISASGLGGVLVHVDPGRSADLVATTDAATAVMQGREMPGWLRVSPEDLASDDGLSPMGGHRHRACAIAAAQTAREQEAEEVSGRYARPSASSADDPAAPGHPRPDTENKDSSERTVVRPPRTVAGSVGGLGVAFAAGMASGGAAGPDGRGTGSYLMLSWRPGWRGLCSWSGAPGSLVGTTFVTSDLVRQEPAMATQNALAATGTATPASGTPDAGARPAELGVAARRADPCWCRAADHHFGAGDFRLPAALLDLDGARFEYGSLLGHPPRLEPDGSVTMGRSRWDVELPGLPAEEVELRTFGNGRYYGRFMLKARPGSRPSLQARLVADQAGRAFGASHTPRSAS